MNYLLLALAVSLVTTGGVFYKIFDRSGKATFSDMQIYNLIRYAVPIVIIFIIKFGTLSFPSGFSLACGIIYGITSILATMLLILAIKTGPLSLSVMFCSCSIIVPVAYSLLFLGGKLSVFQAAGMAFLFAALILSAIEPKKRIEYGTLNMEYVQNGTENIYGAEKKKEKGKDEKSVSLKWFSAALGSLIINGMGDVTLAVHQNTMQGAEINELLIVTYICMTVLFGAVCLISRFAANVPFRIFGKTGVFLSAGSAGMEYTGNWLLLFLMAFIAPAIIFPSFYGGIIVLTTVIAVTAFRERLSAIKWAGLAIGCISLVLLQL